MAENMADSAFDSHQAVGLTGTTLPKAGWTAMGGKVVSSLGSGQGEIV